MFRCLHHATIDSTNLEALRAWISSEGGPHPHQPLQVSADVQTAGRGRTGRPWQSPIGGLWMSIAWPPTRQPEHYVAFPLAVGLAVVKTVGRVCRLDCAIKWPNDVLVHDRKLCGILCQYEVVAHPPVLIVGLGINGNYPAATLGSDLRQPATSLLDQTGHTVNLTLLRDAIARQLAVTLQTYDRHGLSPMLEELRQRLAWRDRQVTCDLPDGSAITGRLIGLDTTGRLVLDDHGSTRLLSVGDIRRLRTASPDSLPTLHPVHDSEFAICRS